MEISKISVCFKEYSYFVLNFLKELNVKPNDTYPNWDAVEILKHIFVFAIKVFLSLFKLRFVVETKETVSITLWLILTKIQIPIDKVELKSINE